jgi:hypothetical protein
MGGYYLPFDRTIRLGQQFGWNPGLGPNPAGGHNGDDWLTPVGTPVRAAGDGEVVFAGQFDSTYEDNFGWNLHYGGLMVVLNMDGAEGPYFEYGHNSRILVSAGQRVQAGQIIAITGNTDGNTGISTGPHCHVGALPPNYNLGTNTYGRVNPRLYMTEYWDGSINLASAGTITTSEEDDMPSANEIARAILDFKVDAVTGGQINLGAFLAEARHDNNKIVENTAAWLMPEVVALRELVKQLSVAQGVVIDYNAIAKAVNDDAASRMKG